MNTEEIIKSIEKQVKNENFMVVHKTLGYDGTVRRTYGKSGFEITILKPSGVPDGD